jgi:uncharacterized SAM-binding protein YcdF (DUF218 family)
LGLFLSKLVPVFVLPLGLALLLMIASRLAFLKRWAGALALVAIVVLWVTSTPIFANALAIRLESAYPPVPIALLPTADAIVLLGGIVGQPLPPSERPDLNDRADRMIEAWRIFRSGKASAIVVSGGNTPWSSAAKPEAEIIRDYLVEFGVPESAIILESTSRNTHENAVNTAHLLRGHGWRSALLVTSAFHMPRAVAAFERAGVGVTPAPTDFHAHYPLADTVLDFLPNADALAETTSATKEWLGLIYYGLRGWA